MQQLVECVPNFSEGMDMSVIKQITGEIETVEGIRLLDVDPGKATNRTVVTFVGNPKSVVEAAFRAIKKASEVIDMSKHKGEHPRMGATDVCPLVPVSGITMEETVKYAKQLGERVGRELKIPVYLYEYAAASEKRKNLSIIRGGEYEGLPKKILQPQWKPDYGPAEFNAKSGATVIGARDFLVAYNVNLNTTSVARANSVAFDIREAGRVKTDPKTGAVLKDDKGEALRIPGKLKSVKAIGWYIQEYGIAQISINLTNINVTPVHIAFEECCKSAELRGLRVTGSELVGLIPLKAMLDAGKYFLAKQKRSSGVSEGELIKIAVKSLGLDDIAPFEPNKKIIEYLLRDDNQNKLVKMTLSDFTDETASESPAPGGGSISAYIGALGASLGTMVANLSSQKKGWEERWKEFSEWAEKGQSIKDELLNLVDEDTNAFNKIMAGYSLPKSSDEEKAKRSVAIQDATKYAIEVPLKVMKFAHQSLTIIKAMAENGNPNSVSDAGVGALCARTAVHGAYLNIQINAGNIKDETYKSGKLTEAKKILDDSIRLEKEILDIVASKIK
jgi:glutamate formiminotransferase / formiminotetrahydrofolate cyclodeaminase